MDRRGLSGDWREHSEEGHDELRGGHDREFGGVRVAYVLQQESI